MSDCESLTLDGKISKDDCPASKMGDRDDISGLTLNMPGKLDGRSLFIIWIVFLFVHTEMFGDHILKRFSGARNDDGTMTMKGTLYASFFLMLIVVICSLVF